MTDAFTRALAFVLRPEHDGQGYHVSDQPTAWGIIRPTLADYRGVPVSQVTPADLRKLTKESVTPIYRKLFWEKFGCDRIPAPLGFMLLDFSVTSGAWASKRLQRLVGATEDGVIGPKTAALVNSLWLKQGRELVESYAEARLDYYKKIPGHQNMGGWFLRAERCRGEARKLALQ